jgi:hypothetical protein
MDLLEKARRARQKARFTADRFVRGRLTNRARELEAMAIDGGKKKAST